MSKATSLSALLEVLTANLSPADIVASNNKAAIAKQITDWRLDHSMSQGEFADYLSISQSTVSKWESGDCNFSIEKLAFIAVKLDLNLSVSMRPSKASSSETKAEKALRSYSEIPERIGNRIQNVIPHSSVVSITNSARYKPYFTTQTTYGDSYDVKEE